MELMIVIIIIGIVAGIAYPSFNRMTVNGNLRTAAREIMSDIASLKEGGMAHNTQYSMIFNTGTNSYTIPRLPDGALITKTPSSFGQGIRLTGAAFGSGSTIAFLTRGTLQQPGNIVLTNSRGSTATITCNISGRTYVQFAMQ
jgi:Tfp pilus assembly protein PilE